MQRKYENVHPNLALVQLFARTENGTGKPVLKKEKETPRGFTPPPPPYFSLSLFICLFSIFFIIT